MLTTGMRAEVGFGVAKVSTATGAWIGLADFVVDPAGDQEPGTLTSAKAANVLIDWAGAETVKGLGGARPEKGGEGGEGGEGGMTWLRSGKGEGGSTVKGEGDEGVH